MVTLNEVISLSLNNNQKKAHTLIYWINAKVLADLGRAFATGKTFQMYKSWLLIIWGTENNSCKVMVVVGGEAIVLPKMYQ